jgi:hypothetical protein
VAATLALLLSAPLPAWPQSADDQWQFSLMPYLWLPTIDGTVQYHGRGAAGDPSVSVKAAPGDYLSDLEMALLLAFEARKGKWLLYSDVTYMKIGADDSSVRAINFGGTRVTTALDTGTQTDIKSTIWTVAGGYNLVQEPKASLDLIAGARYLWLEAKTNWQLSANVSGPGGGAVFPASGSVTESDDIWDVIVGVKGKVRLGESQWFMPYYLDVGAGGSQYTWQAQTGIGYAFRWGDLLLGYRYLVWEQDSNTKLVQDLKLYGFALAGIFRF